jgi:hypothetical protein
MQRMTHALVYINGIRRDLYTMIELRGKHYVESRLSAGHHAPIWKSIDPAYYLPQPKNKWAEAGNETLNILVEMFGKNASLPLALKYSNVTLAANLLAATSMTSNWDGLGDWDPDYLIGNNVMITFLENQFIIWRVDLNLAFSDHFHYGYDWDLFDFCNERSEEPNSGCSFGLQASGKAHYIATWKAMLEPAWITSLKGVASALGDQVCPLLGNWWHIMHTSNCADTVANQTLPWIESRAWFAAAELNVTHQ